MLDLCLVAMPYGHLHMPSLGVGLLAAGARQAGLQVKDVHPKFWFAERIGLQRYAALCSASSLLLVGEMTFSAAAFPEQPADYEKALRELRLEHPQAVARLCSLLDDRSLFPLIDDIMPILSSIVEAAKSFIDEAAERILALDPALVGCSSSFEQHCASLALLRRIKELAPHIITLIGGANCEGEMGRTTAQLFPWIDFAVSGEADLILPELCKRILEQGAAATGELPAGVLCRSGLQADGPWQGPVPAAVVDDLDLLPPPDYAGYFDELEAFSEPDRVCPMLPMESSRGCWWSQRRSGGCRFCGQNGGRQRFRTKSPARVVEQLQLLRSRHKQVRVIHMADTIFPPRYFRTLLPELCDGVMAGATLFWEMLPTVSRRQMALLAAANVRVILAGIESLHDGALALMNKGVSAAHNLAFLKYAMEQGCFVVWNLLHRLPGEELQWYEEMASWFPLVLHLQPPTKIVPIQVHRFSEYHRDPASYGLDLAPISAYERYVYPLPPDQLAGLAYIFSGSAIDETTRTDEPALEGIGSVVRRWQLHFASGNRQSKPPTLTVRRSQDECLISDTRPCAPAKEVVLAGLANIVYRECDAPRTRRSLLRALQRSTGGEASGEQIERVIDELVERKLMLCLGDEILSLALLEPVRSLPDPDELRWGYVLDGKLVL